MNEEDKRVKLLSQKEYDDYYRLPRFQPADRPLFFALNEQEQALMQRFRRLKSQVFFILQLSYFRDKQQFFDFSLKDVKDDVKFILKHHFNTTASAAQLTLQLGEATTREQRRLILELCEYQLWSTTSHQDRALEHLASLIRRHPKGKDTFREFLVFLEQERLTLPSYRTVQDLLTITFRQERARLDQHLATLTPEQQTTLADLVDNDNGLSHLNLIRCDQPDFHYRSVQAELKKLALIANLYPFSQTFMPTLGLSKNAVRYYASVAEQYPAARLRKLTRTQQSLYVLCFIYHRYQEFMDNLITSFLYYAKDLKKQANKAAIDASNAFYQSLGLEIPVLAKFLQWNASVIPDDSLTALEFQQKGFTILNREKQKKFSEYLLGNTFDKNAVEWTYYETHSRKLALYLRPILLAVSFTYHKEDATLSQLFLALRNHYLTDGQPKNLIDAIPEELLEKLPKKIRPYLISTDDEKAVEDDPVVGKSKGKPNYDPTRLEFYIYEKMAKNIEYGRLYCNDSVAFADLDDDLVDDSLVDNVEAIAKECGYPKLAIYCGQRLEDAVSELDKAWKGCNGNIASQQNTGLKIKAHKDGSTTWSLSYDADEDSGLDFFKGLEPCEIALAIKSMGDRLNIWPEFQHKLFRYLKHKTVDPMIFTATVLAEALDIGYDKMADQSNVSLTALRTTHDDYLYVENLMGGNALLSDYIDQLPVSRAWDLYENKRVADGDGQKFVTKFHTLQSRFSAKYYRTRRGISIYSIVANHIPINAQVIGPHEHESQFLFDVLYNNSSHIPIDFITGDNHSINQMNYVATDVIDTGFIPNIKQIREAADKLYCVGDPKEYAGFLKPCGEIDLALIKSEERGILRVLISLLLQENSQAVIMRKLSSHKRHSRLQRAFWEYNKIFKTTHILNVVNDSELRKVIKTARNRTESYHQLQRGLRKVGSGLFKGRRIVDNQISCQATRLIANFIIAYNATLLNGVYLRLVKKYGEAMAQSIMTSISPVAWSHIVFTGRYHFKNQTAEANFEALIARLEKNLLGTLAVTELQGS